jgi:hypothetical protein
LLLWSLFTLIPILRHPPHLPRSSLVSRGQNKKLQRKGKREIRRHNPPRPAPAISISPSLSLPGVFLLLLSLNPLHTSIEDDLQRQRHSRRISPSLPSLSLGRRWHLRYPWATRLSLPSAAAERSPQAPASARHDTMGSTQFGNFHVRALGPG